MKLSEAGELSLVKMLRRRFGEKAPGLVLGIGDDAAVVRTGRGNTLLTTDMMVEGVHFDLRWMTPSQLGYKLVSVNVSDIYAMGGRPAFFLLNFAAPGNMEMSVFDQLFSGIEDAAGKYGLRLAGGDMSASEKLVISATVMGFAAKVITRKGARPGDLIYVTGALGDSGCGLKLLEKGLPDKGGQDDFRGSRDAKFLIKRHVTPEAVSPDRFVRKASAMMDISDGLLIDLSRLCRESGVGARLRANDIPLSPELRRACSYLGIDPLEMALGGGEDYELLFTAPAGRKVDAFCIGEITRTGMYLVDEKGSKQKVSVKGYQHFAD